MVVFIFLVLTHVFAQEQSSEELAREIEQILRDNYNYSGRGIRNPYINRVKDSEYLDGLKKFLDALSKTNYVRDFAEIDSLYISNKKSLHTYQSPFSEKILLYFPASKPAEAFIGLISSDPDNEPAYQQYLKDERERINHILREKLGRWSPFHEAGRKILCERGGVTDDKEKIKRLAERFSDKRVEEVKYRRSKPKDNGDYHKVLEIRFDSPLPSRIEIVTYYADEGEERSYVQVDNKKKRSFFSDNPLTQVWFNSDCSFTRAKTWEYNDQGLLLKRQWFDADGELQRTVFCQQRNFHPERNLWAECLSQAF